jgi:hypothetical protein
MAAGAEQRLEDYHFLRNTYLTVGFIILNVNLNFHILFRLADKKYN